MLAALWQFRLGGREIQDSKFSISGEKTSYISHHQERNQKMKQVIVLSLFFAAVLFTVSWNPLNAKEPCKNQVSGVVFWDLNGDFAYGSHEPIASKTVITLTNTDQITQTTTSDTNGLYSFGMKSCGSYKLNAQHSDGRYGALSITVTTDSQNWPVPIACHTIIQGLVFQDSNSNGKFDQGERPFWGAIELSDHNLNLIDWKVVKPDGLFNFSLNDNQTDFSGGYWLYFYNDPFRRYVTKRISVACGAPPLSVQIPVEALPVSDYFPLTLH